MEADYIDDVHLRREAVEKLAKEVQLQSSDRS
jgi:hypothetical protein